MALCVWRSVCGAVCVWRCVRGAVGAVCVLNQLPRDNPCVGGHMLDVEPALNVWAVLGSISNQRPRDNPCTGGLRLDGKPDPRDNPCVGVRSILFCV